MNRRGLRKRIELIRTLPDPEPSMPSPEDVLQEAADLLPHQEPPEIPRSDYVDPALIDPAD